MKRFVYLDVIKILAILFVVYNHVIDYINLTSVFSKIFFAFSFDLCKVAVPLFIMISGSLLLRKDDEYKNIYGKRIIRIFVPLVLVIILNLIVFNKNFHFSSVHDFLFTIIGDLNGEVMPYWSWYLFMLWGLYIMLPFIRKMVKNFDDRDFKIFILIFCLIVSFANFIPILSKVFFNEVIHINQSFMPTLFSIAIGYFVFGYYVSKIHISRKIKNISFALLFLSIVVGSIFIFYGMFIKGYGYNELIFWDDILVAVPAMCIFVIFKYYDFAFLKETQFKIFSGISGTVFGIYLFHPFLIDFVAQLGALKFVFSYNTIIGTLVLTLVICLILTVIIYLLKKIPFIKNFL